MADERSESSEAPEMETLEANEGDEEESEDEEDEAEEPEGGGCGGESRSSESVAGGESREAKLETLAARSSPEVAKKDRGGGDGRVLVFCDFGWEVCVWKLGKWFLLGFDFF